MFVDPKKLTQGRYRGRRKDGTLRQVGVGRGTDAGRPPHEPTLKDRHEVMAMAGYGLNEKKIAKVKGIACVTLREHYAEELELGRCQADAKVIESLYQNCVENKNVTAQIFWACNRMPDQWRHVSHIHHGGTITLKPLDQMTEDELRYVVQQFHQQIGALEAGSLEGAEPAGTA